MTIFSWKRASGKRILMGTITNNRVPCCLQGLGAGRGVFFPFSCFLTNAHKTGMFVFLGTREVTNLQPLIQPVFLAPPWEKGVIYLMGEASRVHHLPSYFCSRQG